MQWAIPIGFAEQKFVYGIVGQPYLAYSGGGALIAMALVGLWMGRAYLRAIIRKAFVGARDVDLEQVCNFDYAPSLGYMVDTQ